MAFFKTSIGKNIHYEISGEGNPVVLLNGIMMSTASWAPFLPNLNKSCKVILVDLLDMGTSDDMGDREQYLQALQADMLSELITFLGYEKVSIMGISYGGEVAIQFAIYHKEQLARLMLFNTAAYTSDRLYAVGEGWNIAGDLRNGEMYYNATIPYFYSLQYYDGNKQWMESRKATLVNLFSQEKFLERMKRLVKSTETYDVRDRLCEIEAPTLILGSCGFTRLRTLQYV